eukprot:6492343-Amphidinium_carterae.1
MWFCSGDTRHGFMLMLKWRIFKAFRDFGEDFDENIAFRLGMRLEHTYVYTHVAACCLRPFRPTLVKLEPVPVSEGGSASGDGQVTILRQSMDEHRKPQPFSLYSFFDEHLKVASLHDIKVCKLSTRQSPVSHFHGQAYILVPQAEDAWRRVWSGKRDLLVIGRRVRGKKRPLHEMLHESGPAQKARMAAGQRDRDTAADREEDPWADLAPVVDEDESEDEELVQALLDAATLPQPPQRVPSTSATSCARPPPRSNSSSSTSSSSSSSDSPSQPNDGLAALRKQKGLRQTSENTFKWGPCTFTWRKPVETRPPAWQATCPYHGELNQHGHLQTACTRTRTLKHSSDPCSVESLDVLHALQCWLLEGKHHETKAAHQKIKDHKPPRASGASSASTPPAVAKAVAAPSKEDFPTPDRTRKFTQKRR